MLQPSVGLKMFLLYFTPAPLGHQNSEASTLIGSGFMTCYKPEGRNYLCTYLSDEFNHIFTKTGTWEEEGDHPCLFEGKLIQASFKDISDWYITIKET